MQRPKTYRLYFPDSRSEPRSSVSLVTTQHCLFAGKGPQGFREGRGHYRFQDPNGKKWKLKKTLRYKETFRDAKKKGFASDEN